MTATKSARTDRHEVLELLEQTTITVEEAGKVIGVSRGVAYEAARTGQIPTLKVGRRILVPTAKLKAMLGLENAA